MLVKILSYVYDLFVLSCKQKKTSDELVCLCAENDYKCSFFCCGDVFMMKMMFSVNYINTKAVSNLSIFDALKLHDFFYQQDCELWILQIHC
jgi:hypothetical protein